MPILKKKYFQIPAGKTEKFDQQTNKPTEKYYITYFQYIINFMSKKVMKIMLVDVGFRVDFVGRCWSMLVCWSKNFKISTFLRKNEFFLCLNLVNTLVLYYIDVFIYATYLYIEGLKSPKLALFAIFRPTKQGVRPTKQGVKPTRPTFLILRPTN